MEHKPEQLNHPLEQEQAVFRKAILHGASVGISVSETIASLNVALEIKPRFADIPSPI